MTDNYLYAICEVCGAIEWASVSGARLCNTKVMDYLRPDEANRHVPLCVAHQPRLFADQTENPNYMVPTMQRIHITEFMKTRKTELKKIINYDISKERKYKSTIYEFIRSNQNLLNENRN